MIPQSFRKFRRFVVLPGSTVTDVLERLNKRYVGYRTEGIVIIGPVYEIYFSYIENFSLDDEETEEPEEE